MKRMFDNMQELMDYTCKYNKWVIRCTKSKEWHKCELDDWEIIYINYGALN